MACMLVHVFTPCFQCIQSPIYLHRLRQPIDWCSINGSHASIHAHTPHHVHKSLYTLMFFLLWQTCSTHVHLYFSHCLHVFTACMFIYSLLVLSASLFMYSLHVFSAYHHRHMCIVYDNRTTVVPWNVSMNYLHASIHAHTHQHVHILLHTVLSLFLLKIIVVHICMNTFTIVCMYVHVFTPCFQSL